MLMKYAGLANGGGATFPAEGSYGAQPFPHGVASAAVAATRRHT
jgi:hypothetical protein